MDVVKTIVNKEARLLALDEYHNENVIRRFMGKYEFSYEEAVGVFQEMKRFLFIMNEFEDDIFINEYFFVIDEMWHTFLLYTQSYQFFCQKYFGKMLHHEPASYIEKQETEKRIATDFELVEKEFRGNVRKMYSLIYDYLGPETLVKWTTAYGEQYTIAYMQKVRKPLKGK